MILVSATAASCDSGPEVALAAATRTSVSEVVEAPASVTAKGSAVVSSPANGTLTTLSVTPGQTVVSGQVIGVVDSPEAQARLAQATQALKAARSGGGGGGSTKVNLGAAQQHLDSSAGAAFAEARAAAEKIPDPAHQAAVLAQIASAEASYSGVSQNAWQLIRGVERGLASVSSAMRALGAAQVLQAQQAYDLALAAVDALTLKAPMAGVVQLGGASSSAGAPSVPGLPSELSGLLGGAGSATGATGPDAGVSNQLSAGSQVKAGTAVATIVDMSELGLVAEVDETDVLLVREGVTAEAELDAAPGAKLEATVKAIDVLPTPNSRGAVAYKVHLVLSPTSVQPRPGMSALIRLRVREAANAVAVPAAAVFNADGKDWVWVRSGDGKAQRRAVTVGVAGRDLLEIVQGVGDGEKVVVKGADQVREGDKLP